MLNLLMSSVHIQVLFVGVRVLYWCKKQKLKRLSGLDPGMG